MAYDLLLVAVASSLTPTFFRCRRWLAYVLGVLKSHLLGCTVLVW